MTQLVIIPCFNEEVSIEGTISSIVDVNPDAKIVVVDNASTDKTAAKAKGMGVNVISENRPGKGFAFKRGLSFLTPDVTSVLMVDGDSTYGMEPLLQATELVESSNIDMVIGKRTMSSHESDVRTNHYRAGHVLGNHVLTLIFRKFFQLRITDTLSGWRLFSPQFLYSFHGGNSGFELETELNAHVRSVGAQIYELPVSYRGRLVGSESKLSTYKDGWKILRKNIQLVKNERPLFAFGFMAIPWLISSVTLFGMVLSDYFETGLVPRFPSLIVAIGACAIASQLWVTGMILERVRLNRNTLLQTKYREWQLLKKFSQDS